MLKTCSKCQEQKEKLQFYKDKQKSDGLTSVCKECHKKYWSSTKEEHSTYNKTHRPNKNQNKERNKQWYKEHKEEQKIKRQSYFIAYRNKHKEQIKRYGKTYYQKNKETIQERHRRNLLKSITFPFFARRYVSLFIKPLILKRDKYQCQLCSSNSNLIIHHIIPISQDNSISNIINEANLITLCKDCHLLAHDGNYSRLDISIQAKLRTIKIELV